jgi:hypothetical protein
MPAIETRSELMLNDIRIWAMAMTIIGNQETFRSFLGLLSTIMDGLPRFRGRIVAPRLIRLRDCSASTKAAKAK